MARKYTEPEITISAEEEGGDARLVVFRLRQAKVRDGHAILERLSRVIAPVLGELAPAIPDTADDAVSAAAIAKALDAFPRHLSEGDLDWLVTKVRKCAEVASEEGAWVPVTENHWEELFAGEYSAEAELVGAFLKHNFGSFFSGRGGAGVGLLARLMTRASSSSSRTAPRSGSGDS